MWLLLSAARAVRDGEAGGLELAKLLLEKGASTSINGVGTIDDFKYTPLRLAAEAVQQNKDDAHDLVRLLLSHGAALAEDEKEEGRRHVDRASALCLTLHESKPASLTVSWTPGGLEGARYHTVSVELPSGGTLSSPRLELPLTTHTIKDGLISKTEYKLHVIAYDENGSEISRGPVARFSTVG